MYKIKLHISVSSAENVVLRPVVTVSVPEFSQLIGYAWRAGTTLFSFSYIRIRVVKRLVIFILPGPGS